MERVDQRDVDGVHVAVFEHGFIRGRDSGEGVASGKLMRTYGVAACDRNQPAVVRRFDGGNDGASGDPPRAEDPPPDALAYMSASSWAPPRAMERTAAPTPATLPLASAAAPATASS